MKTLFLVFALLVFLPACSQQEETTLTLVTPQGYSQPKSIQEASWEQKADGALAVAESSEPAVAIAPTPKPSVKTPLYAARRHAHSKRLTHRSRLAKGKLTARRAQKVKWLAVQR